MRNKVAIGIQSFEEIQNKQVFYVDKTSFIKEWWENNDEVTLITRPRRFGKTLNISMLEQFFLLTMQAGEIYLKVLTYGKKNDTGSFKELILC